MTASAEERAERYARIVEQAARLTEMEHQLVSAHLASHRRAIRPVLDPPAPVDRTALAHARAEQAVHGISVFKHGARKAAKDAATRAAWGEADLVDADHETRHAALQTMADTAWSALRAHEPGHVMAALDDAFSAGGASATSVAAGLDGARRYATVVVIAGPVSRMPDRISTITATGRVSSRRRIRAETNTLYLAALGSSVLAVVRQAFAAVASLDETRVVVIRHDPSAAKPAERTRVIYTAAFDRARTRALPWRSLDPGEQLLAAHAAVIRRTGAAGDLGALDLTGRPDLRELEGRFALRAESAP